MRIDMNKTVRRILAWILIVTINTLLFFGGENYAWADGILPNAMEHTRASIDYNDIKIDTDVTTIIDTVSDSADWVKERIGKDVEEEEPENLRDEAISKIASDVLDNAYDDFVSEANKAAKESVPVAIEEAAELSRKSSEAAANAQFERIIRGNESEYSKYADEAAEYMKEAGEAASQAEVWKYVENITSVLDVISKVADVASLISDVEALTDLNGEHTATKVIEGVAITADMAVILIGLLCPGANIPIAASIAVGLFAQFMHNKSVTEWMDEQFENLEDWWNDLTDGFLDLMKLAIGINCYKPNIYIYPTEEMNVTVKFKNPRFLTEVIPDYSNIWDVYVKPDGKIYTKEGYVYDYLFYECLTNLNLFERKAGFLIASETRKKQFEDILEQYGFTQEEICDFTEFWCDKLEEGKNYIMYPQMTELVDNAMEIEVTPKPQTCVRIWFVFEEAKEETEITLPEIQRIERTGYTIIEWGGMIQ